MKGVGVSQCGGLEIAILGLFFFSSLCLEFADFFGLCKIRLYTRPSAVARSGCFPTCLGWGDATTHPGNVSWEQLQLCEKGQRLKGWQDPFASPICGV